MTTPQHLNKELKKALAELKDVQYELLQAEWRKDSIERWIIQIKEEMQKNKQEVEK